MIIKRFISDDSGFTVTFETILMFSISVIVMLMIFQSFQDLNQKHNKMMLEEQMYVIGNSVVKKMTEMNLEAISSQGNEAQTSITSEFWIPATIGGITYTIKMSGNQIILETSSDPYITVEVPFSSDIKIAEDSTVYSSDYKYVLQYDPKSSQMHFANGGIEVYQDNSVPNIDILLPLNGSTINNTTLIIVNVTIKDLDGNVIIDPDVTRVEYFVGLYGKNDTHYNFTGRKSFNWSWDTTTLENTKYNVTAIAFHASGTRNFTTKTYTIGNTGSVSPVVTIISPANNSSTYFRKPIIQVVISDNKGRNLSSSFLIVNGTEQNLNATFYHLENQKLTTITYTPLMNMNCNSTNKINLTVKNDSVTTLAYKNWSFNITCTSDSVPPSAKIIFPFTNASIMSGSPISVTYTASDDNSGINNLTINITKNGMFLNNFTTTISEYPTLIKTINPPETWTFPETYIGNMTYSFNITVFDRNGTKNYSNVVTLTVPPGQDSQLEVITSGKTLTNSDKTIGNITLRDSSPFDPMVVTITKINVSWVANSSEHISRVKFDGKTKWNSTGSYIPGGAQFSGKWLTLNQYTVASSLISLGLEFDANVSGKTFTVEFYLSDGTTTPPKTFST
jgi:hypothetical protein